MLLQLLLVGLVSYQLKKLSEGLDKINSMSTDIAVIQSEKKHQSEQIEEIKEKQKQRDTQWTNLERVVSDIQVRVASITGQGK